MANHFADRLSEAVKKKSTPLVVGLDPVYGRLPEQIRTNRHMNDETDVTASVDAFFEFCTRTLKVVIPKLRAIS